VWGITLHKIFLVLHSLPSHRFYIIVSLAYLILENVARYHKEEEEEEEESGNFDVKDALCSGRPITERVDEIMEKIEQDRHISSYDISKKLNLEYIKQF